MTSISKYHSFDEKSTYFTQFNPVETEDEVEEILTYIKQQSNSIWRGCNASYKLYNSFQKYWIENDFHAAGKTPIEYFQHLLELSTKWNRRVIGKYYQAMAMIGPADLYVLSLLRHYNTPVPLLDFTRNPLVALFFGAWYSKPSTGLENYFSLYEINRNHYVCTPYKQFALESLDRKGEYKTEFEKRKKNFKENNIDYPDLLIYKELDEEFIVNFAIAHLSNPINDYAIILEDKKGDKASFKTLTNMNIVAQEGIFVAYAGIQKPLEESLFDYVEQFVKKNRLGSKDFTRMIREQKEMFRCYNINASLKNYILSRLDKEYEINYSSMYPDLWALREHCINTFK